MKPNLQNKILSAYTSLLKKNGYKPTRRQIREECNCDMNAVVDVLSNLSADGDALTKRQSEVLGDRFDTTEGGLWILFEVITEATEKPAEIQVRAVIARMPFFNRDVRWVKYGDVWSLSR